MRFLEVKEFTWGCGGSCGNLGACLFLPEATSFQDVSLLSFGNHFDSTNTLTVLSSFNPKATVSLLPLQLTHTIFPQDSLKDKTAKPSLTDLYEILGFPLFPRTVLESNRSRVEFHLPSQSISSYLQRKSPNF